MSLAAKLLKAKAALGLGDDDAPAKEPMPKQHGGIDKSKKKVRLNARQKAKAAGKAKKPRHAPVEGDRRDRRRKAREAAAAAAAAAVARADGDESDDIEEDTGGDDDDGGSGGGGGGDGKTTAAGSSVAEELVKLAQEAKEAQTAAVASSRKSKPRPRPLPPLVDVFLNQLPYTVTQRDIAGHMAAAAAVEAGATPRAHVPTRRRSRAARSSTCPAGRRTGARCSCITRRSPAPTAGDARSMCVPLHHGPGPRGPPPGLDSRHRPTA